MGPRQVWWTGSPSESRPDRAGGLAGVPGGAVEAAGLAASLGSPFPGERLSPEVPAAAARVEGVPWRRAEGRALLSSVEGKRQQPFPPVVSPRELGGGRGSWKRLSLETFAFVTRLPEKLWCVF